MIDYTTVTEVTGGFVTREAFDMMSGRYQFVAERASNADVLELSCGVGQGLGLTALAARSVVGLDITFASLKRAQLHYQGRLPLVQADAACLPFCESRFDLVAIHEAIYYYPDLMRVLAEVHRVLRPGGQLCVSTINPEWADFNPSPFSTTYLTAAELARALQSRFVAVELFGASPVSSGGLKATSLSAVKRLAVALRLIPKTMKGKTFLKRLAYGALVPVPAELVPAPKAAAVAELPLDNSPVTKFKVIYAIARA